MWPLDFAIFLLGLLIGSFLNVVIYRYGTGGWWRGSGKAGQRSKCFSCGKTLHWYELVPLLSFLVQRGRCRGCRGRIAWQYPAVELLTGGLFLAVWRLLVPSTEYLVLSSGFLLLVYWIIVSLLVVILVYDLRHKIIPDGPVFAFIGLSLLAALVRATSLSRFNPARLAGGLDIRTLGTSLLAALILFLFFWALWYFSKGRWMGFGDAKLVVGVGLLLGLQQGITAIVLAFWSGALVGVGLILVGKLINQSGLKLSIKSEIPFAPFIILGTVLTLFYQFNLVTWLF